jgi:hypothetical protein
MPHIKASTVVGKTPDEAFRAVGSFADASWVPGTVRCEVTGEGVGAVRVVTTAEGARLRERLESYDAEGRRYTYRLLEGPAPIENYMSTVAVSPEANGSVISWEATFDAPPAIEASVTTALENLFNAAMEGLRTRLG